ncbi:toll-like receptor 13 [Saccostrea echinata]|uniref:toll-like receptor 13 n=1 Tax=Saccostrea echinata TaxID=191078 RepID=UPI002A82FD9E|nr:toll-like receptor 13 [Saccostrea echinata]
MPSIFHCFPELQKLDVGDTELGDFPGFCLSPENSGNKLEILLLENTSIDNEISVERLKCLPKLKVLNLSRNNKITHVPHFCNSSGKSSVPELEELYLKSTSISTLQKESLMCLFSLRIIDLSDNPLRDIPTFCGVKQHSLTPNLTSLSLNRTKIIILKGYRFQCLPMLKKLDLRENSFEEIPLFCNEVNKSTNPNLQELILSNTDIKNIFKNDFTCLPSLRKLDLSHTKLEELNDNIFSSLRSLTWLKIRNVKCLKKISTYAFNISSLLTLKFVSNDFKFTNASENMFALCTNVTSLDLSGNHFPTGSLGHLLLKPLQRLEKLSLQENRMNSIHVDTFKSLKKLKILSLTRNKLSSWKPTVFKNLSNLVELRLDQNKIAILNKTSIPLELMDNLHTLTLAINPFDCGCDMIWFKNWCQKTNVTLLSFPYRYTCQTPKNLYQKTILNLNLTEDDCKEKNPWIIILIATSTSAFFLLIVSILISVHLPTIKNVIYYCRLRKRGYVKLLNEQEFKYDAYVVYCEADEKWVLRKLVRRLEAKGIRLCIPDREFEVGVERCSEIENAFKDSRKIVVVLSNEFVKNEWCLWQNNLVEERIRQRGDSTVVFLLYKSINSKNMISSVHRTLKKRSVVTWHEGGTKESMFWKVVSLAVEAPLGEPPVSVLEK